MAEGDKNMSAQNNHAIKSKLFFIAKEEWYKDKIDDCDSCLHNIRVLQRAQPGDILSFQRRFYKHYAVYIGNKMVIHVTINGTGNEVFWERTKTNIQLQSIWEVANHCKASIDNHWDDTYPPGEIHEILQRALAGLMNPTFYYNFLYKNCEHFATECRYNVPISDQADWYINIVPKLLRNKNINQRPLPACTTPASQPQGLQTPPSIEDVESGHAEEIPATPAAAAITITITSTTTTTTPSITTAITTNYITSPSTPFITILTTLTRTTTTSITTPNTTSITTPSNPFHYYPHHHHHHYYPHYYPHQYHQYYQHLHH